MVKIDHFFFGYRWVTPDAAYSVRFANAVLRLGIAVKVACGESVLMRERDFKRFSSLCSDIKYTYGELLGIPGFFYRHKKRYVTAVTLVIALVLNLFLSGLVWDVRVSGTESLGEEAVIEKLALAGLGVGSMWSRLDTGEVESRLLSSFDEISWVAINRVGTVAYVEIVEREGNAPIPTPMGYRNIVAAEDAVIEEITVEKGTAVVKPGDVVKKGDILISGIVTNERGTYLCYAEGTVRGTLTKEITVSVPRVERCLSGTVEEKDGMYLKIFGKSINILKSYGNSQGDYAIIEKKEDLYLFGKHRLPVSVHTVYRSYSEWEDVVFSDAELALSASEHMREAINRQVSGYDLIKLRTEGAFTDEGYTMRSYLVCSADIGEGSPIVADK